MVNWPAELRFIGHWEEAGNDKSQKRGEPYRLFWVECAISLNQAQGARDRNFDEKIKITDKTNGYKIFGDCPEGE